MARFPKVLALVLILVPAALAQETPRFEVRSAALGLRYRLLENHLGARSERWTEHHQSLQVRFRLDREAHYSISALASNGEAFTASWNPRGFNDSMANRIYVKQLYFSAAPVAGIEIQAGGFGIVRGEATEITSYDTDGYLMGERVTLSRPKELFFDEITFTNASLGDLRQPSVTARWNRLGDENYRQLLVRKRAGKRLSFSAEWSDEDGERTSRAAMSFKPGHLLDAVRIEGYQRSGGGRRSDGAGFALTLEKAVGRFRLAGGFAGIDRSHAALNADRFGRGERLFLSSTTPLRNDVTLQVFVTRALEEDLPMQNRTRVDVVLRLDLTDALRRVSQVK